MATDTTTFPEGDAEAELNPGQNKNFEVDPVSSEIASEKVQKIVEKRENAKAKRDGARTLKNTIIVSAVIVAVAGAAFAITKKLKENK
ncbi:putative protein [Arabidopsis thaliana]|uniref:Transmembrane protein n=2 Tax=Arabidopsis TaxID=3701 RepID=Q9LXK2_ARATH|nr:uncharacterized protein AT3G52620 [Arabidopsis thaliana]KAG7634171.1 hypothetical protein ISN44_As03g044270 [Arabidopsis suecica]AAT67578.1 hypothetical protein At3G52620 [Arabidopsis thaliana]AAX23867.1 hypothetical protein At3g52620 [Arabidopsis thaliana]AEE78970.1 transmembrane protein [Arabidopsis thaliana]CAB89223.1 putative protein [Arabidopsis thaliana]|eukprot:NP_190830.1 transmembrane protein [Arabidopsis thaliana]